MSISLVPHLDPRPQMAGEEDVRFLYEQARRYVAAKPWEQLARTSLYLDLKVGSWREFCAQHFSNGPLNALFVFPGRRNMLEIQRAGLAEPPAGTIFVELVDGETPESFREARQYGWPAGLKPIPHFQAIMHGGWLPLERSQMRLLALAFAAITDFDAARERDVAADIVGEAIMPGATRGRYRARRGPAEDDSIVPIMGMPRNDLYGDADGALTFTSVSGAEYEALRGRARLFRAAKPPLGERGGDSIPLVTISGPPDEAADIAVKLTAAEPLGVTFAEMDGVLAAMLIGLKDSYQLLKTNEHREELMLWRHEAKSTVGGHAIVVEGAEPGPQSGDLSAYSIHAIFECGTAKD